MNAIHPKVAGGTLGGALAVIALWGISKAVTVPPDVAAAFTTICAFAAGWFAPSQSTPSPT